MVDVSVAKLLDEQAGRRRQSLAACSGQLLTKHEAQRIANNMVNLPAN
jgi:hypothetical protein